MEKLVYKNKEYNLDSFGYLTNFDDWDEDFAEYMALNMDITEGLTEEHFKIINYIRDMFVNKKSCPTVYDTIDKFKMSINEFKHLFPTGYQRGACKIAGISFEKGFISYHPAVSQSPDKIADETKVYRVNSKGYLIDWTDWDEEFASNKSDELKMPNLLTERHWEIIFYLRNHFRKTKQIPNIYEITENFNLTIEELKSLFPDGYQRGAVKIAGLNLK